MADEDEESFAEFEFDGIFPVHKAKEGAIVEIVDRDKLKEIRAEFDQKFFDVVKKGIDAGKTVDELKKEWIKNGEQLRVEAEGILDDFTTRTYAKITHYEDKDGQITLKMKCLKPEEYKDVIPKIADRIVENLTKEDMKKMVMDVLLEQKGVLK